MIRAAFSPAPGAPARFVPWEEAKTFLASDRGKATLWVDSVHASKEEVAELEAAFALHPLTVEDLQHRNQRAKVEEFADYVFIVVHWFSQAAFKRPFELHCVLGKNFLLTFTDCNGAKVEKIVPVEAAWQRFLNGTTRGPTGADGALYRVLDELVDAHVPRTDELEDTLERINERVIEGEEGPVIVQELMLVRRRLTALRRILAPQRDAIGALARRGYALIDDRTALFFRDVQDHLNRTYEMIESLRELDQLVMDVQLALAESRRSQIIKRLTIVSTIFLPLSFLASFFGMNFTKIPFDSEQLMFGSFIAMALLPALLMGWLISKRWV